MKFIFEDEPRKTIRTQIQTISTLDRLSAKVNKTLQEEKHLNAQLRNEIVRLRDKQKIQMSQRSQFCEQQHEQQPKRQPVLLNRRMKAQLMRKGYPTLARRSQIESYKCRLPYRLQT